MTIATTAKHRQWNVASETRPGTLYIVKCVNGQYSCDCPGHFHHGHCKHATLIANMESLPLASKVSDETRAWGLAAITGRA